jgi:uncharacterized membrane protein YqiK
VAGGEVRFAGLAARPGGGGEAMDLGIQVLTLRRVGREGLRCADGVRFDVEAGFVVRVLPTAESILGLARQVGVLSDERLDQMLGARLLEALRAVVGVLSLDEVSHEAVAAGALRALQGGALGDLVLEQVAVTGLAPTPVDQIDRENILDAAGYKRVMEGAVVAHARKRSLAQVEGARAAAAREAAALPLARALLVSLLRARAHRGGGRR